MELLFRRKFRGLFLIVSKNRFDAYNLSDQDIYEMKYEKFHGNVCEKPQFMKPKLEKRPEWLYEEKINFSC